MANHLSSMGGRVNFGVLREIARKEFLDCLDVCQGTKAIVWDDQLTGPFNAVAEYAHLKEHDVTRMFPLRSGNLPSANVQNVIFLVRPSLALMDIIAENARNEEKGNSKRELHLVFVPRKSLLCEKRLQDSGVYGNFSSIREYCLDFFVFEKDLLTMEIESSYRECQLEGDMTSAYHVAKALMALQAIYGIIPSVYGKGKTAKQVYDLMLRMRRELCGTEPTVTPQIDCLLLIDRNVDLISPLATQLTFEGLIDEIFTISSGIVKLPSSKFGETDDEGRPQEISVEPKQIMLSSKEELYAEIRDKNFNAVGPILSKKAKIIAAQLEERHQAKSIPDFKKFVGKLPTIHADKRSLATQTSIAELVKEVTDSDSFLESLQVEQEFFNGLETDKPNAYIEDCIARQEPLLKILRLLCLQSVTNNGLKPKLLDSYRREVIQTYGFQHFLTLQNLEKAGLLCVQGQRNYSVIRKTLRLTVDEVNELNPIDISYVHSGYAPLSVRLAQFLAKPGWRAITDVLHLLPGPTVEESQQVPYGLRKRRGSGTSIQSSSEDQRVTLVVFLGGCTFAEIAALRFLSQQEDYPTEYVIATTKLINGTSFIRSLMETVQPNST